MVSDDAMAARQPGARTDLTFGGVSALGYVLFPVLLLVLFVVTPYLPMVDLPQHAAQIATWMRLSDPTSEAAHNFTLNLGTPYLTAYVAARMLAELVGVVTALKIVVWLAAVLHQVAFAALVRKLGHARWLAWLGLPLGLGYPFYFGLVSFTAVLPLVLWSLVEALDHREAPGWKTGSRLAAVLCATLVTHGFGLGLAFVLAGPLLLRGSGGFLARMWPLAVPVLLWAVWVYPAQTVRVIGGTLWAPRVKELFGAPALWFAASEADHVATGFGYAVLLLVVASLGRPARAVERSVPIATLVVAFCTFPLMLNGFGPLHPRFAAFFLPALLLAFEPRTTSRSPSSSSGAARPALLAIALCSAWIALLSYRLIAFTKETAPFRAFVAGAPRDLRVRPVVFDPWSDAFPSLPALIHLPAYYMTEKGGLQGYSFAMYPTSVIRYLPDVPVTMWGGAEWHPEWFSAPLEALGYDVILVHSRADRTLALFGELTPWVSVAFHEGSWWAYRLRVPSNVTTSG